MLTNGFSKTSRMLSLLIGIGVGAALLAGCDDGPGTCVADLSELSENPTFAVVSTDESYTSTSIGLLDAAGDPIDECWFSSGTSAPSLVAPLSGDVYLPTEQGAPNTLTLLDRLGTNVVTRLSMPDGAILGQDRTQGTAMDTFFSSNPTDYIWVDANSAWVVRSDANADPGESSENLGNDLIEMNPSTGEFTGNRVDLSVHDVDLGMSITALAHPDRAAFSAGELVVGLARAHYDFMVGNSYGAGAVARVDLGAGTSEEVDVPGEVLNCAKVAPIPGELDLLSITCVGDYFTPNTMGIFTARVPAMGAGLEFVDSFLVGGDPGNAMTSSNVVPLDATHVVALAFGDAWASPPIPDSLYIVDLTSGSQTLFLSAIGIGQPAYEPSAGLLIVPTSERDLVRMTVNADFSVTDLQDDVALAPSLAMSPRSVHFL